jgi:hypothetical protein
MNICQHTIRKILNIFGGTAMVRCKGCGETFTAPSPI